MIEKIYTIPINEALEKNSFCPFCYIVKKLEEEGIEYTLGPAMMEPEFRMLTNEQGFCKRHMRELHGMRNALSLTLVIDTHMDRLMEVFKKAERKKGFFRGKGKKGGTFVREIKGISDSCAICSRIEKSLSSYFDTFVFMLKTEKDFLDKVLAGDGFCMEHFSQLAEAAESGLSDGKYEKCFVPIIDMQKKRLENHQMYIKKFADSFDYRNAGKKNDFPKDILHKSGMLLNGEFEPKE